MARVSWWHIREQKKDIILCAVSSDDESLIVYFQGWILYEWEHMCTYTYTHTHRRKRGSRTPAGSATLSQMALEPHIWHTEVLCHTVILSNAAYIFHWKLSLRVCEYKKRPFKKAWVWVSDLTATTVKRDTTCGHISAVISCSRMIFKIRDIRKARLTIQPTWGQVIFRPTVDVHRWHLIRSDFSKQMMSVTGACDIYFQS